MKKPQGIALCSGMAACCRFFCTPTGSAPMSSNGTNLPCILAALPVLKAPAATARKA